MSGKDAAGFTVRENAGGRSTLLFDYRIVAVAGDTVDQRLPDVAQAMRYLRTAQDNGRRNAPPPSEPKPISRP